MERIPDEDYETAKGVLKQPSFVLNGLSKFPLQHGSFLMD